MNEELNQRLKNVQKAAGQRLARYQQERAVEEERQNKAAERVDVWNKRAIPGIVAAADFVRQNLLSFEYTVDTHQNPDFYGIRMEQKGNPVRLAFEFRLKPGGVDVQVIQEGGSRRVVTRELPEPSELRREQVVDIIFDAMGN